MTILRQGKALLKACRKRSVGCLNFKVPSFTAVSSNTVSRPILIRVALRASVYVFCGFVEAESADGIEQNNKTKPVPRQLEEVIVTAQKRAQSTLEVPISISAIDGDLMRDIGATGIQDVAAYIPNLQFSADNDPALATISIRGLGSDPLNASFEASVGFVQDDIFYARPSYFNEMTFDISRVEVLRGPQGTLFGKNTVSGVFNVSSKDPSDEFTGNIRLSTSSPSEQRVEAAVNLPLLDNLAARLSLLYFDRDGELENSFDHSKIDELSQLAGRLKLAYVLNDRTDVMFTYVKSDTVSNYWPQQLAVFEDGTRSYLQSFDPDVEDNPYDHQLSFDNTGFLDKGSESFTLKTDYDLGDALGYEDVTATLIVGSSELYIDSEVDTDTSPADLATLPVASIADQKTLEFRLTGSTEQGVFGVGESLEYVFGLFYIDSGFKQKVDLIAGEDIASYATTTDAQQLAGAGALGLPDINLPGGLLDVLNTIGGSAIGEDYYRLFLSVDSQATALFAQVTWALSERWTVTPGIRFNREEKDVIVTGESFCAAKALIPNCVLGTFLDSADYAERDLNKKESDVSPKLSIQYFMTENANLFLTAARGFKGGGFNGSSFNGENLEFDSEEASTIEFGMKGKFFENTLEFNATIFQTKFDNLQVLAYNGTLFDVENAASATAEGLEVDFRWLTPLQFLSVSGSAGYLDARYDEYDNAPAIVGSGEESQDLGGEPLAKAQRASASLSPEISLPLFGDLGIQISLDLLYAGSQYSDTDLDPNTKIDPYTSYNGRISVADISAGWSITLGGMNLTDEKALGRIGDTVFFPNTYQATQKPGRKVFLALNYDW